MSVSNQYPSYPSPSSSAPYTRHFKSIRPMHDGCCFLQRSALFSHSKRQPEYVNIIPIPHVRFCCTPLFDAKRTFCRYYCLLLYGRWKNVELTTLIRCMVHDAWNCTIVLMKFFKAYGHAIRYASKMMTFMLQSWNTLQSNRKIETHQWTQNAVIWNKMYECVWV